jgi:hypothetical protein
MNKCLATIALGCAVAFCAEVAVAQPAPTPGERERLCAGRARELARSSKLGLTGARYSAFMSRCTGIPAANSGPALPPAQPPGAAPPPQPPAAAPLSPLAISCNKKVSELGLSGAAAKTYLGRCLAR